MLKCRIAYVPNLAVWMFSSPYGLRTYRLTFVQALADFDAHISFLIRNGIVKDLSRVGGEC